MKRFYNDPDRWEYRTHENLRHREQIALEGMLPLLRPGVRVLDVGCGPGTFLRALHGREPHLALHGVDVSGHQIMKAQTLLPEATLVECDLAQGIPYPSSTFDLVYMGEVLEHLFDPDSVVGEIHRVLRRGGTFVVTTPNLAAWFNRALLMLGVQPLFMEASTISSLVGSGATRRFRKGSTPVGHLRIFTLKAVEDLLDLHGFRATRRRGASFHAFSGPLERLDRALARVPTLGSILVVTAIVESD